MHDDAMAGPAGPCADVSCDADLAHLGGACMVHHSVLAWDTCHANVNHLANVDLDNDRHTCGTGLLLRLCSGDFQRCLRLATGGIQHAGADIDPMPHGELRNDDDWLCECHVVYDASIDTVVQMQWCKRRDDFG